MDIAQTGLQHQPFHPSGKPLFFVPYHAQLAAYHFLQTIVKDDRGIGVFYGPDSAGKSCIVHELLYNMPADTPVAVVDAARLKTLGLLVEIMEQLDPGPSFHSVDDYWYALRIFLAEKTRTGKTPLLVLENFNKMYPSALYTLNKLADLQVQGRYVLRMILMSDTAPFSILHAPSMASVARRSISAFEMGPMTAKETSTYIHSKLRASGCDDPHQLFPADVIAELHALSGGWPGKLDELAIQAIERAQKWPIALEHVRPPVAETMHERAPLVAVNEPVEDT